MNISNILKVADAIEQASVPGLGFNMNQVLCEAHPENPDHTGRHCGTVGCIAGWAFVLATGQMEQGRYGAAKAMARNWLGLSERDAERLFYPDFGLEVSYRSITQPQAARALRNLAITGKVDWEAAMKPAEPDLPPLPVSKSVVRA